MNENIMAGFLDELEKQSAINPSHLINAPRVLSQGARRLGKASKGLSRFMKGTGKTLRNMPKPGSTMSGLRKGSKTMAEAGKQVMKGYPGTGMAKVVGKAGQAGGRFGQKMRNAVRGFNS